MARRPADEQGGAGFADKFAVAPMPTKKSATSFIGGSNLAVFKDAKNRDGAWKFVQWLSKPEVQVKWYQAVKRPARGAEELGRPDARRRPVPVQPFGEQLEYAKAPPAIPTWEQVAAAIDAEVEKVAQERRGRRRRRPRPCRQQASSIGTGA